MNPIQGKDAILSFYKDAYVPYVCATDLSVVIDTPSLSTRTRGSGPWRDSTYQDIGYTITVGGVLVFDDSQMDGMQLIARQVQLLALRFRIMYTAADGQIKSLQGVAKINSTSTDASVGNVVKGSYTLEGKGKLDMFDGPIPCPSEVVSIDVDGETDPDGNVSITYSYTGSVAQVKYRLDGEGEFIFGMAGLPIAYDGLAPGAHFIEIVPICPNGFEGTGLVKDLQVTHGGSCSSVITNIIISGTYQATNTRTGAASNMKYRVDGGVWINSPIASSINLSGLSVGAHTIEEVPICDNGVEGTGFTKNFTITSQPTQSVVGYDFQFLDGTEGFIAMRIYVNGVLTIVSTLDASGTITVSVGQMVRFEVQASGGRTANMVTTDVTTSVVLDTRGGTSSFVTTYAYIFTANGDEYSLLGQLSNP